MPKITKKDKAEKVVEEENISKKSATKSTLKTKSTSDKTTEKKDTKKSSKKSTKKVTEKKESSVSKATKKKASSKKNSVIPFKSILSRRSKKSEINKESKDSEEENESLVTKSTVLEYYDLPYRYNQTAVKILAQTPSILFVYWDISDSDRTKLSDKYGDNFFETTKPVLLIHNKTKNYSFEVEINDFANSWYLRTQEPDCEYTIELGRRSIYNSSEYVYLTSSNDLISPNDHVLFEKTNFQEILFKNVKNGNITKKDFGSLQLLNNVNNIYSKNHKVYNFYNKFYKDEVLDNKTMFSNPSSSNPTSGNF